MLIRSIVVSTSLSIALVAGTAFARPMPAIDNDKLPGYQTPATLELLEERQPTPRGKAPINLPNDVPDDCSDENDCRPLPVIYHR